MMLQKNHVLWFKFNGMYRYFLAHTLSKRLPLYIVNEYPKSGGSWIGEMISDALDLPFPRNRLPIASSSIMHGHMMHSWNMHNILLVWRDGRDVLVSQYFHSLFENEKGNARLVAQCRADLQFLDYDDVRTNLIAFIEYVYETKKHPRFSWGDFVERWFDCRRCVNVCYEEMRLSPEVELIRIVEQLAEYELSVDRAKQIVTNHSFEKLSGRKAGEERANSFMRKGIVGDWKNYFDQDAKKIFHHYAGDALIKLGYEEDDRWVNR